MCLEKCYRCLGGTYKRLTLNINFISVSGKDKKSNLSELPLMIHVIGFIELKILRKTYVIPGAIRNLGF